jgi:hypothetical protein
MCKPVKLQVQKIDNLPRGPVKSGWPATAFGRPEFAALPAPKKPDLSNLITVGQ